MTAAVEVDTSLCPLQETSSKKYGMGFGNPHVDEVGIGEVLDVLPLRQVEFTLVSMDTEVGVGDGLEHRFHPV